MSEALKLTEFGKFIVKHSVVVPTTFWQPSTESGNMSEALKLTEFGKFIVKHSVVVPTTFWQVIFAKTKKLLDNADTGEEAEDAWQMFLTELRDGCNELLTNDEFLRILHADHGESDE